MDESVARYCVALVAATRAHSDVLTGASPRGSLGLVLTERLGREVPLLALFEHPTVAALAAYLERAAAPAVQEAPADTREREERRREALDRQRRRLAGRRAGS